MKVRIGKPWSTVTFFVQPAYMVGLFNLNGGRLAEQQFDRGQIFLFVVAGLACRYDVAFGGGPAAGQGYEVVHG